MPLTLTEKLSELDQSPLSFVAFFFIVVEYASRKGAGGAEKKAFCPASPEAGLFLRFKTSNQGLLSMV
jgi:hypothetical protein